MAKNKDMLFFYGEFENEQKGQKKFWPSEAKIWTPDFQ